VSTGAQITEQEETKTRQLQIKTNPKRQKMQKFPVSAERPKIAYFYTLSEDKLLKIKPGMLKLKHNDLSLPNYGYVLNRVCI